MSDHECHCCGSEHIECADCGVGLVWNEPKNDLMNHSFEDGLAVIVLIIVIIFLIGMNLK